MTAEQQFILQLLSDFAHKRDTVCPAELDWGAVLRYADSHQIEGILFKQCKKQIPREHPAFLQLNGRYANNLFYYANRLALEEEIQDAFRRSGIGYFFMKGSAVAAFYPVPALRTMGDSDIVVHSADKEKAHELLLSMDYRNATKLDHEWAYYKEQMEFELHDNLLYERSLGDDELEAYFNDCWKHVRQEDGKSRLEWNFHFLFLLVHLRKHILTSGAGFRQFLDLAVLTLYNPALDWRWIEAELTKLGLLKFAQTVLTVCERWFQVPVPIACPEQSEAFFEEMTLKIFENGVFGFDNAENNTNNVVNEIRVSNRTKSTMLRRALGFILPSYAQMKKSEQYGFLRGRPYLLPIAWLYRLLYGFVHRKQEKVTRRLKGSFISEEALAKRKKTLEQWGL